jgi:thiamine biosynthesis lipoprotein
VTVAAPTCTEAGLLSTLAMLQGAGAEAWLAAQGVPHWVMR